MFLRLSHMCAVLLPFILISMSQADLVNTYSVGSGDSVSYVQFEFDNDNTYLFDVAYEDDGEVSGWDLLQIITTDLPNVLTMEYETYSWGHWLQGLGIENDYAFGTGAGFPDFDDYWAYWVAMPGTSQNWDFAPVGADGWMVSHGSWDAWTFHPDGATPPQAIPGPMGLPIVLLIWISRRRRFRLA